MTVGELVEWLKELPQDAEVYVSNEIGDLYSATKCDEFRVARWPHGTLSRWAEWQSLEKQGFGVEVL